MQPHSIVDEIIVRFDKILRILPKKSYLKKTNSIPHYPEACPTLSKTEQKHSAALMRVNHSGEVSAQALYLGQALLARDKNLANQLLQAAEEEKAHLAWCAHRLQELGGHRSLFNPLWAVGSFGIGALAGMCGDKMSLSFLAETEHQVIRHLEQHLQTISKSDTKSQAILMRMREDEKKHATQAMYSGGVPLPLPICQIMTFCSKVMTTVARYI